LPTRRCSKRFREKTGLKLIPEYFTIALLRAAQPDTRRADLILADLDRLRQIAKNAGHFQIITPARRIRTTAAGKISFDGFFMRKRHCGKQCRWVPGRLQSRSWREVTSGVDLWLNTPQFPLEASGTSGMKAARMACQA